MDNFQVYNDINARTNGEIYIGVVGPVRTGKSTFIKRFMEMLVIPNIEDENERRLCIDELPQSSGGRTIMTTEPKFIPKEGATIALNNDCRLKVRLIDCVGFMVEGARGHIENEHERLVKTPWSEEGMPFSQAAEMGTRKVINDHSTIGIVVTSDGSFGDIERRSYEEAENKAIDELKAMGKPFVVLLNSLKPYSIETVRLADSIAAQKDVACIPVNCEQLKKDDITEIMYSMLMEFPVSRVDFFIPKWVEMIPDDHKLKIDLIENVKNNLKDINMLRNFDNRKYIIDSEYIKSFNTVSYSPQNGIAVINIEFDEQYYYQILSDLSGITIENEYGLIKTLKVLASKKEEVSEIASAYEQVKMTGYGVVEPSMEYIELEEPELIRHGNKYGVKIRAISPSIHMIKADIETEIAPIVGTKEQAEDLIKYMSDNGHDGADGIWDTNIFGKTIRQLVEDGIHGKISRLSDESQQKLSDTIKKVINESNGGLVCIII